MALSDSEATTATWQRTAPCDLRPNYLNRPARELIIGFFNSELNQDSSGCKHKNPSSIPCENKGSKMDLIIVNLVT